MLRIWLNGDDLTRVRFAAGPSPLANIVLSAQVLLQAGQPALFGGWRRRARGLLTDEMRPLLDLVPLGGYVPDFLTPIVHQGGGFHAELAAMLAIPPRRIRGDLAMAFGDSALPRRSRGLATRLATGDPAAREALARAMRRYHQCGLAGPFDRLRAHHRADVAHRARTLAVEGLECTLDALHHTIRWRSPVLEIDTVRDGDVHLDGRGLLLTPSVYAWPLPRLRMPDGDEPAALVYPARNPFSVWPAAKEAADPMAALLGRTRAAVLRTLDTDRVHSTSTLAARLGISVPSASQHTAVLRDAGLVTSRRRGKAVHHELAPLGGELLRSHGG